MIDKDLKFLFISDIHLGHHRNQASYIIESLNEFFNGYKHRNDLDAIFVGGDIFDRLLDVPSDAAADIHIWVTRFILFCARNKIKLRVLEGTPSHDWHQSRIFDTVIEANEIEVDFAYADTLSIEYIKDFDMHVLYVPDEWNSSTDVTFEQVQALLKENNLEKVDIAIMHGQFEYQLPAHIKKIPRHSSANYLPIVRYYISIGHIHTFSFYQRIIAQGSFDRLSQNEEEPKGAVEATIRKDGTCDFFFIENKRARIFKTINVKQRDVESSLRFIEKQLKGIRPDSFIRIRAGKLHPIMSAMDEVSKKFPEHNWSKITVEEEQELSQTELFTQEVEEVYVPITIHRDNIMDLVVQRLEKRNLSSGRIENMKRILGSAL